MALAMSHHEAYPGDDNGATLGYSSYSNRDRDSGEPDHPLPLKELVEWYAQSRVDSDPEVRRHCSDNNNKLAVLPCYACLMVSLLFNTIQSRWGHRRFGIDFQICTQVDYDYYYYLIYFVFYGSVASHRGREEGYYALCELPRASVG